MSKFTWMIGLTTLLAFSLEGCSDGALSGAATGDKAKVWLETVRFKKGAHMNEDSPVHVAVAVAYDDTVLASLSKLTAAQYFGPEGRQLISDSADKVQEFDWEVPTDNDPGDQDIELNKAYGKGAFVFAQYSSTDAHRQAISDEQTIVIHLDQKDFYVTKDD